MYTGIINNNKKYKTKRTRLIDTVTPNRHPHHFLFSLTPWCPLFLSLSNDYFKTQSQRKDSSVHCTPDIHVAVGGKEKKMQEHKQ
jgi:hypothetical protein